MIRGPRQNLTPSGPLFKKVRPLAVWGLLGVHFSLPGPGRAGGDQGVQAGLLHVAGFRFRRPRFRLGFGLGLGLERLGLGLGLGRGLGLGIGLGPGPGLGLGLGLGL